MLRIKRFAIQIFNLRFLRSFR